MILQSAISGLITLFFLGLTVSGILPWIFGTFAFIAGIITVNTLLGKPIPFLRWSFISMALSMKTLTKEWQVGDGREEAAVQYVIKNSPQGDVLGAIKAIDNYAYQHKFLINVGDEKGELLDSAIKRVQPKIVLELGAYVGYSALRIARLLPKDGHLYSVEFNPENAKIARRVIEHAGVSQQVTFIDGYLGDGGKTLAKLKKLIPAGSLDMVFIDHDKDAYMADLKIILESRWLKKGSVVVADNVGFPGAPVYKTYMDNEEGKLWNTTTHKTHVEYQSMIPDLVLESTFLG
jgi:catechol O-methyltransferase